MTRLISHFNSPWTGDLSRFDDPKFQTNKKCEGGHIAYRTRSSRLGIDPKTQQPIPEPVRITNRQQQMEFVRAEGLIDPAEVNSNIRGSESGHGNHSRPRGSWV